MTYKEKMAKFLEARGKLRKKEADPFEEEGMNSRAMPEEGNEGAGAGGLPRYMERNLAEDESYKYPPQALAYGGQAHGHPMSREMYSVGAEQHLREAMPHLAMGGRPGMEPMKMNRMAPMAKARHAKLGSALMKRR